MHLRINSLVLFILIFVNFESENRAMSTVLRLHMRCMPSRGASRTKIILFASPWTRKLIDQSAPYSSSSAPNSRPLFPRLGEFVHELRFPALDHRCTQRKNKIVCTPEFRMCKSTRSVNFATTHATTQILVGGVPQELSDQALRSAVEQSGDDTQVTVHIDIAEDLRDVRLDSFLSSRITALSRSALARLIRTESVTVNGRVPKPASKLRAGDRVVVNLPPPPNSDVLPENIPLDILLEDDQIIVVNKQVQKLFSCV